MVNWWPPRSWYRGSTLSNRPPLDVRPRERSISRHAHRFAPTQNKRISIQKAAKHWSRHPYHNTMPFIAIETFANCDTGRMFAKHVHHFQLTFLHDDIQRVWVQLDALRILDVVIDEQAVRQTRSKLKWDFTTQSKSRGIRRTDEMLEVWYDERAYFGMLP